MTSATGIPKAAMPVFDDGTTPSIYRRMAYVAANVEGVAKRKRQGDGVPYAYRGVDDIMQAVRGLLADAGLFLVPDVEEHSRSEYDTKSGTTMQRSVMRIRFTFWAPDGSSVTASTTGEAADNSDKAANKAMTAALKYVLLQAFLIPTDEGDQDAEQPEGPARASVHAPRVSRPTPPARPEGTRPNTISEKQQKRLFAICQSTATRLDVPVDQVRARMREHLANLGLESTSDLTHEPYETMCNTIEGMALNDLVPPAKEEEGVL